ncbi:TPA: aminotransferase class I/II-fold pyridoxal phosphate-dependent enzyme [Pasteurella multocida]|nr:aminotransferase class I/II-fold pyridoxal phosphate-dependent enzyme [Pasteurella multocida]
MNNSSSFDIIIDRKNTSSSKWKKYREHSEIFVFTIADMDFKTPKTILNELSKIIDFGILGYSELDDKFVNSCVNWLKYKHNWHVCAEWIVPCTTIKGALNIIINELTDINDNIYSLSPGYKSFFNEDENRVSLVEIPIQEDMCLLETLKRHPGNKNPKLFFFTNPHNPTGKVWNIEELKDISRFCIENKLILISDDIHQDIILSEKVKYTPIHLAEPSIIESSIICLSPSKTFNISGLQASYLIIANVELREKITKKLKKYTLYYPNIFAIEAYSSAYNNSELWLKELIPYLKENYFFIKNSLKICQPFIQVKELEATYLAWVDFRGMNMSSNKIENILLTNYRIVLENGNKFGKNGEGFFRINFACPRSKLVHLVNSLIDFTKNMKKIHNHSK